MLLPGRFWTEVCLLGHMLVSWARHTPQAPRFILHSTTVWEHGDQLRRKRNEEGLTLGGREDEQAPAVQSEPP